MTCVWRAEDNIQLLVLSFYHLGPNGHLDGQVWPQGPLPSEPSHQPHLVFLETVFLTALEPTS